MRPKPWPLYLALPEGEREARARVAAAADAVRYAASATDRPVEPAHDIAAAVHWVRRAESGEDESQTAVSTTLLRDVFGNPVRPAMLSPAWLTSTVVQLARGIYHDRAFDRLPILADALLDAGCDNADMLDHCRGEGPHVRGCWVVDLLLGMA